MTAPHWPTTRELPLEPGRSALLVIDVQNYCAHRNGGEFAGLAPEAFEAKFGGFFEQFERVALPNLKRLIAACRRAGKAGSAGSRRGSERSRSRRGAARRAPASARDGPSGPRSAFRAAMPAGSRPMQSGSRGFSSAHCLVAAAPKSTISASAPPATRTWRQYWRCRSSTPVGHRPSTRPQKPGSPKLCCAMKTP